MKNRKIAIIGLGYVGLPLAHAFAHNGYSVVGFDINKQRIEALRTGIDATMELTAEQLNEVEATLSYSSQAEDLRECSIFIVTVPTPIDSANMPDLTPLIRSSQMIATLLKKGDIVIYESTVYPGVTEEVCVPELESLSRLTYNKDFFCGYSPERINPGDKEHTVSKILKVTSGSTPEIAEEVDALYRSIITAGTYKASSIKVAEASKVIENTQRDVNIALMNELALIFHTMHIDTKEVIEAAATKWNFIKLSPGLVGGHCIGVDPYYLTYKAEDLGYTPNLILGARQINNGMGKYVAEQTIKEMIKADKKVNRAKVLILGMTFKENCADMRNTKVVDIIKEFHDYNCTVDIYDPWVEKDRAKQYNMIDNPFESIQRYDAIVVAVAHRAFESFDTQAYESISTEPAVLIDIKGVLKEYTWRL